jgi:hypothetical protein
MIELRYFSFNDYEPDIKGNYMIWSPGNEFRTAFWDGDRWWSSGLYTTSIPNDIVFFWARIPSLASLEVNYNKEI